MKHINLDMQDEHVKQFVLNLELDADGSVLEADGKPVARVLPVSGAASSCDREKLKQAILNRRDESRALNADWEDADCARLVSRLGNLKPETMAKVDGSLRVVLGLQ